jgi:putative membrane protein
VKKVNTKKLNKLHLLFLFLALAVFIWSAIKPEEGYMVWSMEILPGAIILCISAATYRKHRLTTLSYLIIALLSILTFIGGHFSYSKVPLFNWMKDYFHLERNHYDRFGHFMKGSIVIVIRELLLFKTPLTKGKTTFFIAMCIALSIGAFYEIIEWLSTKITGGNSANKDFLGMQGDKWDAQWDMSLLLLGAIFFGLLLVNYHNKLLALLQENPNK